MSEFSKTLSEMRADNALNMTKEYNSVVRLLEEAKATLWRVRLASTNYSVGDKVIIPGVSHFDKVMRCVVAGITGGGDFPADYNSLVTGSYIVDGSVTWCVVDLVTFPDMPDSPVTSVNNKRGDVYLNATDVGAAESNHSHPISDVISLQTALNGKASIVHEHTADDITDLQDKLDEKADSDHTHRISEIQELDNALDGGVKFPNYDAAIDCGTVSTYNVESDGWIFATGRREGQYWNLRINDVVVFVTGGSSYDTGSCFIPVKNGEVIKTYDSRDEIKKAFAVSMVFFPNR